jgi:hypothetical protein
MDVQSDTKIGKDRPVGGRRFAWAGAGIRLFILLLIGALIFVVMREWDWWVGSAALQSTDDAYLQADTTPLAAKVPGYVSRVLVQDFQRVRGGDVLVEIVDDDYPPSSIRRRPMSSPPAPPSTTSCSKSACRKRWSSRPRPKSPPAKRT